tara:strand:- start:1819 stop:2058 length:240 start_codon:yes stop_codon:yes gene_type:complete
VVFLGNFLFLAPNQNHHAQHPSQRGGQHRTPLKQFKKRFDQTKTMKQLRTRREFVKPSVLNREMRKKAAYKNGLNLKSE